jgi:dTDP-4-amino-4,6-dideoxygalactose transaminase
VGVSSGTNALSLALRAIELAEQRGRLLCSHGESRRYHHRILADTARLEAIHATVLGVKLADLDARNQQRRDAARALSAELADIDTIALPSSPDAEDGHAHTDLQG